MKTWRVLLLMLLALLLPVRGAMAAAMLCPPGGHGHTVAQAASARPVHHHPGHQHASQQLHQHHAEAPADRADPHTGDTHGSGCHVCASFCSMTPMLSDIPGLPQPVLMSSMNFPTWSAPEPLFLSDGQERPPRSI